MPGTQGVPLLSGHTRCAVVVRVDRDGRNNEIRCPCDQDPSELKIQVAQTKGWASGGSNDVSARAVSALADISEVTAVKE